MKTENIQKKRGRPELENKSVPINWRCPHHLHQFLLKKQREIKKKSGVKTPVSKVLENIVEKSIN
jgi:hypothetical protein